MSLFRLFRSKPKPPPWVLIDPRPLREASPYTFFLPSDAEKAAIRPGDRLKLLFEPETGPAERMWVAFERADDEGWVGTLDNQPVGIPGLAEGDTVRFQPWNILSVWESRVDDYAEEDSYFARARVDARILKGAKVDRMERETPADAPETGFPDTGWTFYADGPLAEDFRYVAVGVVLNTDAAPLAHLTADIGTRLRRDGDGFIQMAD